MATNIKRHTQYYTGNGAPKSGDAFSSLNLYAHYFDRTAKKYYIYMGGGSWIVDPEYQITGGSVPTVSVGTTTTLPAGSQATVTDTDPSGNVNLNFGIPKGDKGDAGSGGGTSVETGTIVVVPTGGDDTSNLRAALAASKTYGKEIKLYGTYSSAKLEADIDHINLVITGSGARINAREAGNIIGRKLPTDNTQALNNMAEWHISGLRLYGNSTNTGIYCGPSQGSTFNNIKVNGCLNAYKSEFALRTKISMLFSENCTNGIILDYGKWSGGNTATAQTNKAIIEGFEYYAHENGGVGVGIYGGSNNVIRDSIFEGSWFKAGIEWDAKGGNNCKYLSAENIWFEPVGKTNPFTDGCTEGFCKLRMSGNDIFKITGVYGQGTGKFLDASSTSGLSYIEVANVTWWRGKGDTTGSNGQGKMFSTSNVTLHFEKNHAFNNLNSNMWEGTAPTQAGDGKEGNTIQAYHTYTINYINPK